MPEEADIPLGLDAEDLVPCGCLYEEAILEEFLVVKGVWDPQRDQVSNNVPNVPVLQPLRRFKRRSPSG